MCPLNDIQGETVVLPPFYPTDSDTRCQKKLQKFTSFKLCSTQSGMIKSHRPIPSYLGCESSLLSNVFILYIRYPPISHLVAILVRLVIERMHLPNLYYSIL